MGTGRNLPPGQGLPWHQNYQQFPNVYLLNDSYTFKVKDTLNIIHNSVRITGSNAESKLNNNPNISACSWDSFALKMWDIYHVCVYM